MPLNLQLPNDVTIQSVQELAWNDVAIDFLLHQVAAEEFAATATALVASASAPTLQGLCSGGLNGGGSQASIPRRSLRPATRASRDLPGIGHIIPTYGLGAAATLQLPDQTHSKGVSITCLDRVPEQIPRTIYKGRFNGQRYSGNYGAECH
jgi:hypothetical protein